MLNFKPNSRNATNSNAIFEKKARFFVKLFDANSFIKALDANQLMRLRLHDLRFILIKDKERLKN